MLTQHGDIKRLVMKVLSRKEAEKQRNDHKPCFDLKMHGKCFRAVVNHVNEKEKYYDQCTQKYNITASSIRNKYGVKNNGSKNYDQDQEVFKCLAGNYMLGKTVQLAIIDATR